MGKLVAKMARNDKTNSLLLHGRPHGMTFQNLCAFLNRRRVFLIPGSKFEFVVNLLPSLLFSNPALRRLESPCLSSPDPKTKFRPRE